MKKTLALLLICFAFLSSCHKDNDDDVSQAIATFSFSHSWDGTPVTNTDFNSIKYTNANGEALSITKLRYLISKIIFTSFSGEKFILEGYNLVDVTNNTNLSFSPTTTIPFGTYTNVSFIFGFDNDDNYLNYPDLNSASWNVPSMMGGGYHFMQLEGKFVDNASNEIGYAYHVIRAVDVTNPSALLFQDTFFEVDLGEVNITGNTTFNIEMNIAEWFKNPNTWDLNILNNMLMPNFDAQVMMYQNGQNAFSLTSITP